MNTVLDRPYEIEEGVVFTVIVGFLKRECLIPRQTLSHICRARGGEMDSMAAFRAYEDMIISVAQRMIVAGAAKFPVVLERRYFP